MPSLTSQYAERLRIGFATRVFDLRATGVCGSLMPVSNADGCYEVVTMNALCENFDGLQVWIDAEATGETLEHHALFKAFCEIDAAN